MDTEGKNSNEYFIKSAGFHRSSLSLWDTHHVAGPATKLDRHPPVNITNQRECLCMKPGARNFIKIKLCIRADLYDGIMTQYATVINVEADKKAVRGAKRWQCHWEWRPEWVLLLGCVSMATQNQLGQNNFHTCNLQLQKGETSS